MKEQEKYVSIADYGNDYYYDPDLTTEEIEELKARDLEEEEARKHAEAIDRDHVPTLFELARAGRRHF